MLLNASGGKIIILHKIQKRVDAFQFLLVSPAVDGKGGHPLWMTTSVRVEKKGAAIRFSLASTVGVTQFRLYMCLSFGTLL